jgi:hypothetical protein
MIHTVMNGPPHRSQKYGDFSGVKRWEFPGEIEKHYSETRKIVNETRSQIVYLFLLRS